MSEALRAGGEKSAENMEAGGFGALAEMSDKFDPDRARKLAEVNKPKTAESPVEAGSDAGLYQLAEAGEQQNKELNPKDAANEYLALLDELSQDFVNPNYENGKMPTSTGASFAKELGLKYGDDSHYRWRGYAGTEADPNDRTIFRMGMADSILASEIEWRGITDEEVSAANEKRERIEKGLADLDAEYSKKGPLGKFFGRKGYERRRGALNGQKERPLGQSENELIARGLAYAYDESGGHSFSDATHYQMVDNEALNRRFFGLDNPERAEKIERAIELRQKYADEWEQDASQETPDENFEQQGGHEGVKAPEFLNEIDDARRREIIDVSANLSEKIPESMIMGGNALRILYEARTGNRMFGVGKNDHDIYVPVAKVHEFMERPPEGYVVRHELDERGQEKWIHPERDYVVISEVGSDGQPHEHIDVFGKDGRKYTEVELDGRAIRVQSLTDQIADKIDMYIGTDRFNKVEDPATRDKNGVYAQRMLELIDAVPDEVDESRLPEGWRGFLTAIAAEGKYGVAPDETPEEKAAREKAINERIELERRREQAKNDFVTALSNYFAENHDLAEPAELPPALAGPLAGHEDTVSDQLNNAGSADTFVQGIMSAIGTDAVKKVVERVTKDVV